jgi:hypothetical protein
MTIGVRFDVIIDFKHVFWSILGHITYFLFGYFYAKVKNTIVNAIPVAIGNNSTSLTN